MRLKYYLKALLLSLLIIQCPIYAEQAAETIKELKPIKKPAFLAKRKLSKVAAIDQITQSIEDMITTTFEFMNKNATQINALGDKIDLQAEDLNKRKSTARSNLTTNAENYSNALGKKYEHTTNALILPIARDLHYDLLDFGQRYRQQGILGTPRIISNANFIGGLYQYRRQALKEMIFAQEKDLRVINAIVQYISSRISEISSEIKEVITQNNSELTKYGNSQFINYKIFEIQNLIAIVNDIMPLFSGKDLQGQNKRIVDCNSRVAVHGFADRLTALRASIVFFNFNFNNWVLEYVKPYHLDIYDGVSATQPGYSSYWSTCIEQTALQLEIDQAALNNAISRGDNNLAAQHDGRIKFLERQSERYQVQLELIEYLRTQLNNLIIITNHQANPNNSSTSVWKNTGVAHIDNMLEAQRTYVPVLNTTLSLLNTILNQMTNLQKLSNSSEFKINMVFTTSILDSIVDNGFARLKSEIDIDAFALNNFARSISTGEHVLDSTISEYEAVVRAQANSRRTELNSIPGLLSAAQNDLNIKLNLFNQSKNILTDINNKIKTHNQFLNKGDALIQKLNQTLSVESVRSIYKKMVDKMYTKVLKQKNFKKIKKTLNKYTKSRLESIDIKNIDEMNKSLRELRKKKNRCRKKCRKSFKAIVKIIKKQKRKIKSNIQPNIDDAAKSILPNPTLSNSYQEIIRAYNSALAI